MKAHRLYLLLLIVVSILTYQMVIINPVVAFQLPAGGDDSLHYQMTPSVTPIAEEVLTTDPILLQIIIVLGILAVLVIFIGVWISRRQVGLSK